MNLKAISLCSQQWAPLEEITAPSKVAHALRYDYDFEAIRTAEAKYLTPDAITNPQYGVRPGAILDHLPHCDWLWFTGADTVITGHDQSPNDAVDGAMFGNDADIIFPVDVNGINNDSAFYRNCFNVRRFLLATLNYRYVAPNDQAAYHQILQLPWTRVPAQTELPRYHSIILPNSQSPLRVLFVPQRWCNSYSPEGLAIEGRPNDPGAWQPGDLLCHCPAIPFDDRCRILDKYAEIAHKAATQAAMQSDGGDGYAGDTCD